MADMLALHAQANGFCRLSMGNDGFATTRYRDQRLCQKAPSSPSLRHFALRKRKRKGTPRSFLVFERNQGQKLFTQIAVA